MEGEGKEGVTEGVSVEGSTVGVSTGACCSTTSTVQEEERTVPAVVTSITHLPRPLAVTSPVSSTSAISGSEVENRYSGVYCWIGRTRGMRREGLTRNQLFIGDIQHKGRLGFRTFAGRCFKLTAYKNLLTAGRKGAKYQKEPCKQRKFQLFHSSWIHPFPWKIILYRRFGTKWCRIKSRENLRKSGSRWHSRSPLRQEQ